MKTFILTIGLIFSLVSVGNATMVYQTSGTVIQGVSLKIANFHTRREAERYAKKVDGEVFKEMGQELYRVIWGNVKINDVVVVSTIE